MEVCQKKNPFLPYGCVKRPKAGPLFFARARYARPAAAVAFRAGLTL